MRYNGIALGSILLGMGLITDKIPLGIRFGSLHTTRLVVALHRAGIQVLVEFWVGWIASSPMTPARRSGDRL